MFDVFRKLNRFRGDCRGRWRNNVEDLFHREGYVIVVCERCENWSEDFFDFLGDKECCFEVLSGKEIDECRTS